MTQPASHHRGSGPVAGISAALLGLVLATVGCQGSQPSGGPGGSEPVSKDGETTECVGPTSGCSCEADAPPVDCYLEPRSTPEGLVCNKGTIFCRDGTWSECESLETYTIEPDYSALVTGPDECNPCNPDCATNTDRPTDGDLTPENSTSVTYDPGAGGITLIEDGTTGGDLTDRDGDGVPDVADDYPDDSSRWHTEDDDGYFHVLPYGGPPGIDPLEFQAQVTTADVYFLMDTTGSMGGELNNLQNDLTSGTFIAGCPGGISGAIRCTIPDAWFGVGRFDDYPVGSFGSAYGGDVVYRNVQDITDDLMASQTAVSSLGLHYGADGPESQTQALYAMATGNGLDRYLSPRGSCGDGRWGYPCFRPDTIPIVVMFTDNYFHNGPSGYGYGCWWTGSTTFCPPSWWDTVDALTANDVRVITVNSGIAEADGNQLAIETDSLDDSGSPYVFNISYTGTGLSTTVVDAIDKLANETLFDVSARATDNPSTGIDERGFVSSITVVGWGSMGGSCTGPVAGASVDGCTPGTVVDYRVEFQNDFVMPTMTEQVFEFYIEVLLNGSVQRRIPVRIVVPPEVPTYPPSGSYVRDYDATTFCDIPPQRPEWGTFEWTASTPSDTAIRFDFRTAGTEAGLDSAAPVSVSVPPRSDVDSVDVGSILAAAGESPVDPYLRVTAVLLSSSDMTAAPTLTELSMQYNCFAAE